MFYCPGCNVDEPFCSIGREVAGSNKYFQRRDQERSVAADSELNPSLDYAIGATMNGIAAGLHNTG
jgi:hypothetical protein